MLLTKCYWGDQIKDEEMSKACDIYRGEQKFMHGFDG
jgi:hypothetical protein